MQNKYIGDAGDFSKYLLLKNICKTNLILGINWCWVKDEKNKDGKFTGYLDSIDNRLDPELSKSLKIIISNPKTRTIRSIESSDILPSNTIFFSEEIPLETKRFEWHDKSLQSLKECDVIFYDPDNGLEINSIGKLHPKAVKYVYFDEIRETYKNGKSIVIYQHTNRSTNANNQINIRVDQLSDCLSINKKDIRVVLSSSGTTRYFLIIKQPKHAENIDSNSNFPNNKYLKIVNLNKENNI